ETSLFDALAEMMGYPYLYTMYGGSPPARAGVRHATVVPYGAYRCGNGDQVLFAVQTQKQWTDFCTIVCEHPEWVDDPRFDTAPKRRINRDVLEESIETSFAPHQRAEITRRLEVADVPYSDLNTVAQFVEHPQLQARDRWRPVKTPNGEINSILPPFGFDG